MTENLESDFWYPTVEDIVALHDQVTESNPDSEPGVREPDQIQFAIDYISEGYFGQAPETVHEKAFHLMRLIAANHWFVDGNKRTALNTTNVFYAFNGYHLSYGDDLRAMLKLFSVRESLIDQEEGIEYLEQQTSAREPSIAEELGIDVFVEIPEDNGDQSENDHER